MSRAQAVCCEAERCRSGFPPWELSKARAQIACGAWLRNIAGFDSNSVQKPQPTATRRKQIWHIRRRTAAPCIERNSQGETETTIPAKILNSRFGGPESAMVAALRAFERALADSRP